MTQKQFEALENKKDKLEDKLEKLYGEKALALCWDIVELELLLEAECNQ